MEARAKKMEATIIIQSSSVGTSVLLDRIPHMGDVFSDKHLLQRLETEFQVLLTEEGVSFGHALQVVVLPHSIQMESHERLLQELPLLVLLEDHHLLFYQLLSVSCVFEQLKHSFCQVESPHPHGSL